MRVGLLEDDQHQADIIRLWLRNAGHTCAHFGTGTQFVGALRHDSFDIAIFDWLLPDINGLATLDYVRREFGATLPIVFVTRLSRNQNIVDALRHGADDYLTKPVVEAELLARLEAIMRRISGAFDNGTRLLDLDPFRIDLDSETITRHGERIPLTSREYEFALFLFRHAGEIVSRHHLMETVWEDRKSANTRTIDTHACRIRRKLNLGRKIGWQLVSVYQHGYRLERIRL